MVDPREMKSRGKIGGFAKAALYPPDQLTSAARSGFLKRFEPTDPTISDSERQRRTECALKAYMAKLARLSARARRR